MARIISIFGLVISILLIAPFYWILRYHTGFTLQVADTVFWIYVLCVMVFTVYVVGSQNREKKLTFSVSVIKRRLFLFMFCEMTVFMFGFVVFALNHPELSIPLGLSSEAIMIIYRSYLILLIIFLILAIYKAITFHGKN